MCSRVYKHMDFPGGPVVRLCLPMQGLWVRSLVEELRSHMPHNKNTKHKAEAYCNKFNKDFKNGPHQKKLHSALYTYCCFFIVQFFCHVLLFATPWFLACQAPLSMEFSRQEYWSGYYSLLQAIFMTHRSKPGLLHCRQMLYHLSHQRSPYIYIYIYTHGEREYVNIYKMVLTLKEFLRRSLLRRRS